MFLSIGIVATWGLTAVSLERGLLQQADGRREKTQVLTFEQEMLAHHVEVAAFSASIRCVASSKLSEDVTA